MCTYNLLKYMYVWVYNTIAHTHTHKLSRMSILSTVFAINK